MSTKTEVKLPELDYAYDALEPLYSAEMLELHHSAHHQAYVDGANEVLERMRAAADSGDSELSPELHADLAFNMSGHVMHSIFWKNIAPEGSESPDDSLAIEIGKSFGSEERLREQFSAAGTSLQGSGWAVLGWEPASASLTISRIHDHDKNVSMCSIPLLVMDMWEHAYYLQYRNEKKKWVRSFWELVDWRDVSKRCIQAQSLRLLDGS